MNDNERPFENTEVMVGRMIVSMSPGTGRINIPSTAEQAAENMRVLLEDSIQARPEVAGLEFERYVEIDEGDGRFGFKVTLPGYETYIVTVLMPGIALDKVRYMREEGQDIWDFPRLYVNGSSWVWVFALIDMDYFQRL